MKQFFYFLLVVLFLISLPVFAQEDPGVDLGQDPGIIRNQGDQTFSFNVGFISPLFSQALDGTITSFEDHINTGFSGALEWHAYLNSNMKIGGTLSGMFAFTPNDRVYSMVPLMAIYTYTFNFHPFTVPLSIGTGVSFNRLDSLFQVTPIVQPAVGIFYNIDHEWSIGLNVAYWWVPELYFDDLQDESRFGNFIEPSISLLYHF